VRHHSKLYMLLTGVIFRLNSGADGRCHYNIVLSLVHSGNKIEFNTVDFVELAKKSASKLNVYICCRYVQQRSTFLPICCRFNNVNRVEFIFVDNVYRTLQNALNSPAL